MSTFEDIRYTRQANFDIGTKEVIDFEFDMPKKVYGNCNLSIFIDDYCNADCMFCVAQLRYENRSMIYKKPKIEDDEEYFRRVEEVLERVAPLNVSVSLTGGEPTLSPRFIRVVELLDKYNIRKKTITTNGSALLKMVEGKRVIDYLIDAKFDHLNISKAHYNEAKNRILMPYPCGEAGCTNEALAEIIPYALSKNLRPRLSCLLLKDGIHDLSGMVDYIEFYKKLGIDNIIFRELMDYDERTMINMEKVDYCKYNKVRLNDIWQEVDKDSRFVPEKNILGYYYYVEIYNYKGVTVCSESADLRVQKQEKDSHKDFVYEMVFHPNGNLNGSWVDSEDILLKYNS
jgi:cyclic pyranopterin phosphate synthase